MSIPWTKPEWTEAGPDVGLAAEIDHVQVTVIETDRRWQLAWQVNLNIESVALPEVEEIVDRVARLAAAFLRDEYGATYESDGGD